MQAVLSQWIQWKPVKVKATFSIHKIPSFSYRLFASFKLSSLWSCSWLSSLEAGLSLHQQWVELSSCKASSFFWLFYAFWINRWWMGDEHVRQAAAGSAFTVLWWVTIIQSQRLQLRAHHDLTSVLSLTSHLSTISVCLLLHISVVYLLCFSTRWFPVICLDITVQIIYIMWPIMKFQCNKQDVKKIKNLIK